MTAEQSLEDFAREHNGLDCVRAILSGQFRVACHDTAKVELIEVAPGFVKGIFRPEAAFNNSSGRVVQGGSLAIPLDGIITLAGRTLVGVGQSAITTGVNLTFKRPVSAGNLYHIFGYAHRIDQKTIQCHGNMKNEGGDLMVSATVGVVVREMAS